jgi:hypothetical protein
MFWRTDERHASEHCTFTAIGFASETIMGLEPCEGTTEAWYTIAKRNSKIADTETLFTDIKMLLL